MGNRPDRGKAQIMSGIHENTAWEHYAEESFTHDDYGTRPFVPQELSAVPLPPCPHLFVSYHGSRAECQDCGETVTEAPPVEIEIPMFFQTELRSDGEWPR